jgi:hypothetical protein
MGVPNKDPIVTPSALLRCNDDSAEHADVEPLTANVHRALIDGQMADNVGRLTKDYYDRRDPDRPVVVSFVTSIHWPGAVQQFGGPDGRWDR